MKTVTPFTTAPTALAALGWVCFGLGAALAADITAVTRKGEQMFIVQDGALAPMTAEVSLPQAIQVFTNGTFTVEGGAPRPLKDGERLGADGLLLSPDGRLEPVFDHLTLRQGKVRLVRDGQARPLTQTFRFPDGSRLEPDGTLREAGGRLRRLLDGQLLRLNGAPIPVKDTISLQQGRVVVQKDGALLSVAKGRSLMMNDGTKVFGDGTVQRPDGTKYRLVEGQIVTVDGVVTRK